MGCSGLPSNKKNNLASMSNSSGSRPGQGNATAVELSRSEDMRVP
eukprot:CAMPEP_0194770076 /NCGR_PEP_ID=MMETSP0323_2-20130528/45092_1 /TAXON_ID=2866 ORGANISM="Crypthecodinium cohnii, Strain Seligo" /NCGR_SAMPLE_ID=MMETSP0323_2 /ASSEMBLY_ACC=CAM_ASM_000346 /LENGTH=44 /DNA_ID= /DNA_START= /DNA_END= /DNA_ORIENTATION=